MSSTVIAVLLLITFALFIGYILKGGNLMIGFFVMAILWAIIGMVPFDTALNSCTINPARVLRVDDRKGRLVAGYDADMVVLEDDYSVAQTYCRGTAML